MASMVVMTAVPAHAVVNTPPATPVITEPEVDGQIVHCADVHMESDSE
jgi:hypothetical protein